MLPASESMRVSAIGLIKGIASEVERLVIRGDYAEIRSVDAEDFDDVIKEPKRVVIVIFDKKLSASSRGKNHDLDEAIKKLPARVLVAKVSAEENRSLMKELNISELPTIRIYQSGSLVSSFERQLGEEELVRVVDRCLNRGKSDGSEAGYIGPMNDDWLPEGVYRNSFRFKGPGSKLE